MARQSIGMRIGRSGETITSASLYPVRAAGVEQVLLPEDEKTLVAIGEIAKGESRARLYVAPAGRVDGREMLMLCLRGTPDAIRVSGPVAVYADNLLDRTRHAMYGIAARHRTAGNHAEALRWKRMARQLLVAKRAGRSRGGSSLRTVSGGLPTLGKRR
ncbi:hypothetical protein ABT052_29080 [Streptomyces sp. NPDC002766]|uniref:hypothetical protein n=1 Tax=Streptomyces sp. NPDC002766 TaxID=3154429 RepID=UPI003320B68E